MHRIDFNTAKLHITHPSKIAVASSFCDDKINLITLEWFMRTSINPPMFAISIGKTRFSHYCLEKNRYFNLCFPSKEMKNFAVISGKYSGKNTDKLKLSKEKYFEGRYRKLPVFSNAAANFECETITQITSGDHIIYVGKVIYSWLNSEKKLLLYKDMIL